MSRAIAPRWTMLVPVSLGFAVLFAFVMSPRTALYWYAMPLFGIGACYLFQFREEIPRSWTMTFAATAVLSAVALALDWPFSGHVLWNLLFIAHADMTGKRRSAWMALLLVSLVHLLVMKAVFQTGRDVVGAFISIAVAALVVTALRQRHDLGAKLER